MLQATLPIYKLTAEVFAMANEEQLAILKQGVDVWNKWREKNTDVRIDLTRADLSESWLVAVNFSDSELIAANLIGANLSRAYLERAQLFDADLSRADLSDV